MGLNWAEPKLALEQSLDLIPHVSKCKRLDGTTLSRGTLAIKNTIMFNAVNISLVTNYRSQTSITWQPEIGIKKKKAKSLLFRFQNHSAQSLCSTVVTSAFSS